MDANQRLKGVFAPVLTPFDAMLEPDAKRFIEHCRWLLDHDAGLAVFGTNSEANSMSVAEKMELLDQLMAADIPAARVMMGNGCSALTDTVTLTQHALSHGVVNMLTLPPFYYKGVSDDGLFDSYVEIIERVADERLKIYLYHIPQVSSVPISMSLIERLLKTYPDAIAGVKDSSGEWDNTLEMLTEFGPDGFNVFAGSESFLLATLQNGGAGCIASTTNVSPKAIVALFNNWTGDDATVQQTALDATRSVFLQYAGIPAYKAAVAHFRSDPEWANVRPPLQSLTSTQQAALVRALQGQGFTMPGI